MRTIMMLLLLCFYGLCGAYGQSPAVRRGEIYFFDYCAACHSLKYIEAHSISSHQKLLNRGQWQTSLRSQDAQQWFGQIPPDLSLEAQRHSKAWIKAYLLGFYDDTTHPFGRNNRVFEQVAMPDVLYVLGDKREQVVVDIVAFLDFIAYPERGMRYWIGIGVMLLCGLALVLTWRLKKLFEDLHD